MRKRYLVGAVIGVLGLALSAVAIASPQFKQTSKLKYSKSKGKVSTGFSADVQGQDPGTTPPGDNPPVATVTIRLKGAKIDTRAGKRCTKSRTQAASCPRSTRIGSGSAVAHIRGIDPDTGRVVLTSQIQNTVTAYLTKNAVYLVIKGTSLPTTVILRGSMSKNGKIKFFVSRDVPALPGGNKIVLERLTLKLARKSSGRGKRKRHLIRTPKCTRSRRFRLSASYVYESGSPPITNNVTQRCRR